MHWSLQPCPTGEQQPPQAAAGPSGAPPPAPPALLLRGGSPPPRRATCRPWVTRGGGGGGRGTAAELHGLATRVYDLWAVDFATEPRALALRRWAESTVFAWARELRGVGRAGLLYAELSRADALARHPAHLAAMGKSSAALRGTISAVRMAEKLQLLRPTVGPIHWAIAARAGRAYNSEPGQQVWGTLGMPQAMATAVRTDTDLAVLALAVPVPVTVCGSERLLASAGLTSASRAGSASTTARPSGAGSPPGWERGRSAGDRPCWRAASCSAEPSFYPSSPRQNSSAACTAYCGVRHGSESAGTAGGDSRQQPWLRREPPSPPCASGTDGRRSGRHGSTRCQGPTGSSNSQTRPPGHTRS